MLRGRKRFKTPLRNIWMLREKSPKINTPYAYITLIEFGDLLAKTSKIKKLTFLTNKYSKLKLRHWPKWYLTQKVWIQSYMMLLISLNFTVFIIFVDLFNKYISIYAGLPIQNELKNASKQPIARKLKVSTRN